MSFDNPTHALRYTTVHAYQLTSDSFDHGKSANLPVWLTSIWGVSVCWSTVGDRSVVFELPLLCNSQSEEVEVEFGSWLVFKDGCFDVLSDDDFIARYEPIPKEKLDKKG